jgi:hypothetical protein
MTGRQAKQKLQKPIFGDESHIEALKICGQVARVRQYRNHADEIDIDVLDEFYDSGEIPKPEDLTADELEEEMDFWQSAEEWEEE